jgi:nucleoside-diphosphate-sugar epimerase
MTKLVFGCGYLGLRVAKLWLQAGETVYAVTRSSHRALELQTIGLKPLVADITNPPSMTKIPEVRTVLFAVGYDRSSADSIHRVYVDGLANALAALPPQVERFIYVSSTGVYGQSNGNWVDEDSPCNPVRAGGVACLDAERTLTTHPLGQRSIILRMAGIYGPGRIPRRKDLQAGRPIAAPSEGYLNLIHVDDAARAVLAAERCSPIPALYCIADGQPVPRHQYYDQLAQLIHAPRPAFTTPAAGSPAMERAGSSKRISSRRFAVELDFQLLYPTYCEGLAAIVQEEAAERGSFDINRASN